MSTRIVTDPDEARNVDAAAIREFSEGADVVPLLKAHFIEREGTPESNVISTDEDKAFSAAGALKPPFDPETLVKLFQHSNSLRPNIDAYHTNIDGFGHRFEPIIDLDDEDADEQIRNAIFLDRLHEAGIEDDAEAAEELLPTDEEVEEAREKIALQMRLELSRLKNFFDFCCADISFAELRQRTRQDKEIIGWGAWEVLRNDRGDIVQLNYIPAFSVRLLPLDARSTDVSMRVRISDLSFEEIEMKRRFRRFVQVFEQQTIYFKEFGDPRTISMKTGKVVAVAADGEPQFEDDDGAATELLYWPIHNPESAYGVPRWIGNLLSVIGSRQSEEVNFLYFDNKSVPPMALLVSGGRLSGNSVDRIRDFIKNNIRGRKNFHSIMVIEAETPQGKAADNSGRVKIEMKPLTSAQHNDALFQKYDERNIDKVGMSFRLPRMLRGDIRDFNRSTADAALAFAEMQVFQPEREDFDFAINRKLLLNEMGIRYWRFISNAPITRDPAEIAKMIKDLMNSNAVTALDVRPLLSDVFNRKFRTIRSEWAKQPIPLTVAGISFDENGQAVPAGEGEGEDEMIDPDATPEAEEEAFGDVLEDLEELVEDADTSTGDLAAGGGLRRPAQRSRRRRTKTAIERALEAHSLERQAIALVRLREALNKAMKDAAAEDFSADTARPDDNAEG